MILSDSKRMLQKSSMPHIFNNLYSATYKEYMASKIRESCNKKCVPNELSLKAYAGNRHQTKRNAITVNDWFFGSQNFRTCLIIETLLRHRHVPHKANYRRLKFQMLKPFDVRLSRLFAVTAGIKRQLRKPTSTAILITLQLRTNTLAFWSTGSHSHRENARPSCFEVRYKASWWLVPCFSLKS